MLHTHSLFLSDASQEPSQLTSIFFKAVRDHHFDEVRRLLEAGKVNAAVANHMGTVVFDLLNLQQLFRHYNAETKAEHDLLMLLIRHGALKHSKNLAYIVKETRELYKARGSYQKNTLDFTFCSYLLAHVDTYQEGSIPLTIKRLAINCALLVEDVESLERIIKKPCAEESEFIAASIDSLVHFQGAPASFAYPDYFRPVDKAIAALLRNTALCIELLKPLNALLASEFQRLGVDVATCHDEPDSFVFCNLPWPAFNKGYLQQRTHGALNKLLLAKERQHGINEDVNSPPYFEGFIPEETANNVIRAGYLFNEFNLAGNPLHGKYSHRLQWYIIMRARELGLLKTDMSIKDILCSSMESWPKMLDLYFPYEFDTFKPHPAGFCAPAFLHSSLLLLKEQLPSLSFAIRKTYFQSLHAIQLERPGQMTPLRIGAQLDAETVYIINFFKMPAAQDYYAAKQSADRLKFVNFNSLYSSCRGSVFFRTPVQHESPVELTPRPGTPG